MKRSISVDLLKAFDGVKFYEIYFKDEQSEFDKFQDKFDNEDFGKDVDLIFADIESIGLKDQTCERDFRYEGTKRDNLCALPSKRATRCRLRVFCLRIGEHTVILGNGFHKTTDKYQEDLWGDYYANTLLSIDKLLQIRIEREQVHLFQGHLYGNLTFYIEDERPEET